MSPTGQTVLCLINAAAHSRTYFERLAPHLSDRGIRTVFALDSHLTDFLYADGSPLADAAYFTDFCQSQPAPHDEDLVRKDLSWSGLLSDFDRLLTIGIPTPLKDSSPLAYRHVPLLLERFFTTIFDRENPAAVIYEQASNSFALAANEVARKRGIPFFSLAPGRMAGRVEISPTGALRDHVTISCLFEQVRAGRFAADSRAIAERYIKTIESQVPDYMRRGGSGELLSRTGLWRKYFRLEKLRHVLRGLRYRHLHRRDVARSYMFGDPLIVSWSLFRRSLMRRLRVGRISRFYNQPHSSGEYFLYPLHFHPEASTSVLAPDFIDELNVIKAIAFRLPAHTRLLVKEHPSAVALQPTAFYRQLDALPNVELIGPGVNAKQLARSSIGVFCVTSTLGFEAAAMNKPVISLGDVLYGYFPNVRMVEHYGELSAAIEWAMSYEPIDPEEIAAAVTAYVEFTDPGSFSFGGSRNDPDSLANIASIIAARLASPGELMSRNHPMSVR